MLRKTLLAAVLATAPLAQADSDFDNLGLLTQQDFRNLAEDLGAALSYKSLAPAEPLGVTGFDIGLEVTATKLEHSDVWERAGADDFDYLPVPKLHVHKGLPLGFDVGAFIAVLPDTDMKLYGGEVRYSFVSGNTVMPAFAVRGGYSRLGGVDELDFEATSLELTVSKGFVNITPYAGVGQVWSTSTPHRGALQEEDVDLTRVFAGANINLGLGNLAFEADKTGDNATYGAKFGFRF